MVVIRPRAHVQDYRALHRGGSHRQRSTAGSPLRPIPPSINTPSKASQSQQGRSPPKAKPPTPSGGQSRATRCATSPEDDDSTPPSSGESEEDDPLDPSFPEPSPSPPRVTQPMKSRPRRTRQAHSTSMTLLPAIADTSASTSSTAGAYDEAIARTAMLQSLAPLSLAPRAIAPPTGNLSYHQRIRKYFTDLKNGRVYQLSSRPPSTPSWAEVVALRREKENLEGSVRRDALLPGKPLAMLKLDEAAIITANTSASHGTLDAVSAGHIFGLPFAASFEEAPILGVDDNNLTVRRSTGETLLQRFSPTSLHQASQMKRDWAGGKALLESLFTCEPQAKIREGAQTLHLGGWVGHDGGGYGWTEEHSLRRPDADKALHWIWKFFHAHVSTFACYLEKDFQEDIQMRELGFERYRRVVGEGQSSLAHSWWTLATVGKGFADVETNHASDKEPSIIIGFEEPCLLYVAHREGFFKVILRPGQVVFFRSHLLHQFHPLTQPRDDSPRYSVELAMPKCIASLDGRGKKQLRLLKDPPPPQPAPGDKATRISYAGVGRSRVSRGGDGGQSDRSAEVDVDEERGQDEGEPPELAVVAGRLAWEREPRSSGVEGGENGEEEGRGEK